MRKRNQIKHDSIENNKAKLLACFDKAYNDAIATGYGFIVMKQNNKLGVTIAHAPWLDVKDALEDMGAIGALGGRGL